MASFGNYFISLVLPFSTMESVNLVPRVLSASRISVASRDVAPPRGPPGNETTHFTCSICSNTHKTYRVWKHKRVSVGYMTLKYFNRAFCVDKWMRIYLFIFLLLFFFFSGPPHLAAGWGYKVASPFSFSSLPAPFLSSPFSITCFFSSFSFSFPFLLPFLPYTSLYLFLFFFLFDFLYILAVVSVHGRVFVSVPVGLSLFPLFLFFVTVQKKSCPSYSYHFHG